MFRPGERILPITVSFTLAVLQDENGSTSSEWVVFHRKLKIKGWNLIESLPVAMASESRIRVDPGHPRLFLRPGVYRPLELSLSIDNNFSTKHPNEGVEK